MVAVLLLAVPSVALAGKDKPPPAQKHADAARKSAEKHAAKGNDDAAKNMAKIAEQRQKQADRQAASAANKKKK